MNNFDYVAFVDIDGVLNHSKIHCEFDFLQESIDTLNILYDKYNIKLVLSSSWRHAFTFFDMQELFKTKGINAPLIDRTYIVLTKDPVLVDINFDDIYDINPKENIYSRESEILEWLKMFKPKHFVVLDDYLMNNDFLSKHQLKTDYWGDDENKLGLRKIHLDEIYRILEL